MQVAVVLRLAPELSGELEINDDGKEIDREWVGMRLNEFDDHAVEEAILLKEADGTTSLPSAPTGTWTACCKVRSRGVPTVRSKSRPALKAHCRPALRLPSSRPRYANSVLNSC